VRTLSPANGGGHLRHLCQSLPPAPLDVPAGRCSVALGFSPFLVR